MCLYIYMHIYICIYICIYIYMQGIFMCKHIYIHIILLFFQENLKVHQTCFLKTSHTLHLDDSDQLISMSGHKNWQFCYGRDTCEQNNPHKTSSKPTTNLLPTLSGSCIFLRSINGWPSKSAQGTLLFDYIWLIFKIAFLFWEYILYIWTITLLKTS